MILNLPVIFKRGSQFLPSLLMGGLWFSVNALASTPFTGLMPQEPLIDEPVETSCTALAPDIEYTYPQLHARLFQRHAPATLPSLSQTWQVVCSAPVSALFLTVDADQQADTLSDSDPTRFGLGPVNGQGRLGTYQVILDNAMVDGMPVQLYQTTSQTLVGESKSSVMLKSAAFQGWTRDGHLPAKGQHYSVRLTTTPVLNSLQETHGPLVNGGELQGTLVLAFPFSH